MRRGRIKRQQTDKKIFSRTAQKTKTVNVNPAPRRGGIRF